MDRLIDAAFRRTRTVVLMLAVILVAGAASYLNIPREAEPDIPIPIIYVAVAYEGISPGDAENLLARPLETELQTVAGLSEMRTTAAEGFAAITLEFGAGFDSDAALQAVRDAVDTARPDLPAGAEEPVVSEVNIALFPVLTAAVFGPVPERTLVDVADRLQDQIEAVPGVLEVDIAGDREEVLEVLIDPTTMETYNILYEDLVTRIQRSNRLIAAGALETEAGRIVLTVPGMVESVEDVLSLPVAVRDGTVVTFSDVATARRTFQDPDGFARINGQPSVALEVSKRPGANIIETVAGVRAAIAGAQREGWWPAPVAVVFLQDRSEDVRTTLADLQNNVLSAIILVMIVIVATLGPRSSVLVGLAIPGSFLAGIAVVHALGYTLNIVVLFSLILVVGMLVDGAIVVTELADRHMARGRGRKEAYALASKRMSWPIISATATTLAVFVPLLFWPGVVGEFMKYLPITVLITLVASLFMALVFVPVLGGIIGGVGASGERRVRALEAAEGGDLDRIGGALGVYLRLLGRLARHPGRTLAAAVALLVGAYVAYGQFGRGVEFFPRIEPTFAQVQVQARGNLSVYERDALVRRVEQRVMDVPGVATVYARTLGGGPESRRGADRAEDVVGIVQLELAEWDRRPPAARVVDDIRARTAGIAGVRIQVREQQSGPGAGRPIQIRVAGRDWDLLAPTVERVRGLMDGLGGFVDVEDSRPLPGVEWRIQVDREVAAQYGADVTLVGNAVQMVTRGIRLAEYRPEDADGEIEIRVRFPLEGRSLEQLEQLRVPTEAGLVPISNFVAFEPAPQTGTIERIDSRRVMRVSADVAEGLLAADQVERLRAALAAADVDPAVDIAFAGESEDLEETSTFLTWAFLSALFLMTLILVTQFNSIYQALLVMSAIVFATAGVLLGLLLTGRPFGVVMGGIGVIALAGIVVNNNIVLIDTYNDLRRRHGLAPLDAVLRTGAQRMRPVLLTSGTTVLGLMPMVLAMNVDLIGRDVAFGAPSTQWWVQLSSTIAGGLVFATLLTLLLTPCMLVLGENVSARLAGWRRPAAERAESGREADEAAARRAAE